MQEVAILEKIERTANIQAKTFCTTLLLSRRDFEAMEKQYPAATDLIREVARPRIEQILHGQLQDKAQLIASVPILQPAGEDWYFLTNCAQCLTPKLMDADKYVFKRTQRADCMYFVSDGEVVVLGDDGMEKVISAHHIAMCMLSCQFFFCSKREYKKNRTVV